MAEASQSADISPDGRFIAFSDGPPEGSRDIYILSTDGSSKVPLTEHPADDKEPRWSPDGRHIVFLSLRHGSWALWSQAVEDGRPEGLPRLLLDGMQNSQLASWTKRGLLCNKLFVIQEVYVIDVDPQTHRVLGKPRVVDFKPSGTNVCPVWSPDGKHLAFVSRDVDQISEGYVVVMPAEGGQARKFRIPTTHFWNMTLHDLRWIPDSSGLGFSHWDNENRHSIFKLDLATGEWKTWPFLSRSGVPFAAWRADGKAVYFVKRGEGEEGGAFVEWEMETGEERDILRRSEVEVGAGFAFPLKTSRDHKRILSNAAGAIGILDLDTKKIQTIKWDQGALGRATFCPDERYVLAVGTVGEGKDQEVDLCVVSVEDGQVKKLGVRRMMHPREQFMPPDWSPDGRKIALATRLWKSETNLIQNVIPEK
jgi:Tol biopolymer transport system component